jgi:hypothetical protein
MESSGRSGGAAQAPVLRIEEGVDLVRSGFPATHFEKGSHDVADHVMEKTGCVDLIDELGSLLEESGLEALSDRGFNLSRGGGESHEITAT